MFHPLFVYLSFLLDICRCLVVCLLHGFFPYTLILCLIFTNVDYYARVETFFEYCFVCGQCIVKCTTLEIHYLLGSSPRAAFTSGYEYIWDSVGGNGILKSSHSPLNHTLLSHHSSLRLLLLFEKSSSIRSKVIKL